MDAAVYAFVGSIATAIIGGAVAVVTAIINARTSGPKVAHAAFEQARQAELDVKDERIELRDEQLAACHAENARLQAQLEARTS